MIRTDLITEAMRACDPNVLEMLADELDMLTDSTCILEGYIAGVDVPEDEPYSITVDQALQADKVVGALTATIRDMLKSQV